MNSGHYSKYIMISAVVSILIHILAALIFSKQLQYIAQSYKSSTEKKLPMEKKKTTPPKVQKWKPLKNRDFQKEMENAQKPTVKPQKIQLSQLNIKADIAPKVDSRALAKLQQKQQSKINGPSLSSQLPPQIYEIKPDLDKKHLSEFNKSMTDKRNKNFDDANNAAISISRSNGQSPTGTGSGANLPSISLPVNTIRPSINLPPPSDPGLIGSLKLSEQPKLPQISVQNEDQGQLDDVLKIIPRVYIDPRDRQGYFRVDITLDKNSKRLISQPKEVLFVLDTSTSISYNQFKNFVYSIEKTLDTLTLNDRFNIVTFNVKDRRCFPDYADALAENIAMAKEFLKDTKRGGKTDFYRSLRPYVSAVHSSERPRIIYIASDGNTTTRGGVEGVEIISKITEDNQARTSIFAISNGDDTSPFLLDLLTLRNRGFSLLQEEVDGSGLLFENFIKTYSDTVVSNLSYRFSSQINHDQIYPQELPHLYRGGTLSIYGLYDSSQKSTLVQVKGKGAKGPEEITFKVDFATAQKGDASLAQNWAHHKILNLLGQLTDNPNNNSIKNQLKGMMNKYNIPVPYEIK